MMNITAVENHVTIIKDEISTNNEKRSQEKTILKENSFEVKERKYETNKTAIPSEETELLPVKPKGPYALGYKVRVWWDGDKKFFNAKVKKYIQATNTHLIQYTADKIVEEQNLSDPSIDFFKLKNEQEVKANEKLWKLYFARLNPKTPKKPKTAYNLYYGAKMKCFFEKNKNNNETNKNERNNNSNCYLVNDEDKKQITLSKKEYAKQIQEEWKAADPMEKMPYINEAKKQSIEYEVIFKKYLQNMPRGGYPLPLPQERGLITWQRKKLDSCPKPKWKSHASRIMKDGYTVFPNVLSKEIIYFFLHNIENKSNPKQHQFVTNENLSSVLLPKRNLRKRSASQVWKGAIATIDAHINRVGERITVKAPVCVRSEGRFDLELNDIAAKPINDSVTDVVQFVQYLLNHRGKIKTQNVMLSEPGSARQPIHTDSNWEGKRQRDPRPHYFTILIPLTDQDLETGGTRIFPGTHRDVNLGAKENGGTIEGVENPQKAGDALVFDGLLQHHGTENVTGQEKKSDGNDGSSNSLTITKKRNRYFYYMAIAVGADPNTYVTGKSGTFKRQKKRK